MGRVAVVWSASPSPSSSSPSPIVLCAAASSRSLPRRAGVVRTARFRPQSCRARPVAMSSAAAAGSSSPSPCPPVDLAEAGEAGGHEERCASKSASDAIFGGIPAGLLPEILSEALVWSSLHGLVVGDRNAPRSGNIPGVGMVHAPFALLPVSFPKSLWRQACELAPIFNELVDRVSLDGKFLQESLSRTREVDTFTGRLLDIHAKMLELNKTEDIRLGLHRSDYMLDAATKRLYQIELNTISASFPGLSCLVSELHRVSTWSNLHRKADVGPGRWVLDCLAPRGREGLVH